MENTVNPSGYELGCQALAKLEIYLDTLDELPYRNGEVNKTAIARGAKIRREQLYNNPACEEALAKAIAEKGRTVTPQDGLNVMPKDLSAKIVKLERRITSLEQKNAALVAEVYELRREREQSRHIEAAMEEGRRVIL